jgi:hypothetical protein
MVMQLGKAQLHSCMIVIELVPLAQHLVTMQIADKEPQVHMMRLARRAADRHQHYHVHGLAPVLAQTNGVMISATVCHRIVHPHPAHAQL